MKSDIKWTVNVNSRIHITLIGMNDGGYRKNGGVGFSINRPKATVEVSCAESMEIEDARKKRMAPLELDQLEDCIARFAPQPVKIKISGDLPSHSGFGSSTAIRLAALEATGRIFGKPQKPEDLVRASGRGGTSGVGIRTYFHGGLVFDVGLRSSESFNPSTWTTPASSPLVLVRNRLPSWEVGICVPSTVETLSPEAELEFFHKTCPIPEPEVCKTLYDVTYGVVPGVIEGHFEDFCRGIERIQHGFWKRAERAIYGDELLGIERDIYAAGASVVGMSSLGPALFFFAPHCEQLVNRLRSIYPRHQWYAAKTSNSGRRLWRS